MLSLVSGYSLYGCSIFDGDSAKRSAIKVLSRPEKLKFEADDEGAAEQIADRVREQARRANVETFCYYERLGSEFDDCRDLLIAKQYVEMIADETIEFSQTHDCLDTDSQYMPLYEIYKKDRQRLEENQNDYLSYCLADRDFCDDSREQQQADEIDQLRLKFLTEASNVKKHFKSHLKSLNKINDTYSRLKCKERQKNRQQNSFGKR